MGVAFSGAGLGGLIFPFIFNASLENLGLAWTLRIWALCLLVGAGPALIGIRPRLPITKRKTNYARGRKIDYVKAVKKQFGYLMSTLWLCTVSPLASPVGFGLDYSTDLILFVAGSIDLDGELRVLRHLVLPGNLLQQSGIE